MEIPNANQQETFFGLVFLLDQRQNIELVCVYLLIEKSAAGNSQVSRINYTIIAT